MLFSESIAKIIPSLLIVQKAIKPIVKEAENPFYKSSYADLTSILETITPILNKNGLVLMQPICTNTVTTVLLHESGEWVSDEGVDIVCSKPNDPQSQGSAISYNRRYGLLAMLAIPTEDDDAEDATEHPTAKPTTTPTYKQKEFTKDECPLKGVHKTLALRVSQQSGKSYRACQKCDFFEYAKEREE